MRLGVVADYNFTNLAAAPAIAVDGSWCSDDVDVVLLVQLPDERDVAVAEHELAASAVELVVHIAKTGLVVLVEAVLRVAGEARGGGDGLVRWVEVDEVSWACALEEPVEARLHNLRAFQNIAGHMKSGMVDDTWVFVAADGDVKLTAAVDPMQAVEAGLIQVDEHRGTLGLVAPGLLKCVVLLTSRVVALFAVTDGELLEALDHTFDVVADRGVRVDEGRVDVAEQRALWQA